MSVEPETGDTGFDMDSAVASVADGLGFNREDEATPADDLDTLPDSTTDDEPALDPDDSDSPPLAKPEDEPAVVTARPPPSSWPKTQYETWNKLDKNTQDYLELREKQMLDGLDQYKEHSGFGRQMRDVLTPYKAIIDAQGITEPQAIQFLMNAHYRLTQGSAEQRAAAYRQLGRNIGLVQGDEGGEEAPVDPRMAELQERQNRIESMLTEGQRAAYETARQSAVSEVEKFTADGAHPYFDDVADDIATLIKAGNSLADAYDKAVWANPVTRAKELARTQTENEGKLRDKAKQGAQAARNATGANIRSRDTRKAPTEPKGSMEDTMRSTLSKIKERAH